MKIPTKVERAAWRKEYEDRMMTSAIWEYCPEEFEALLNAVDTLEQQKEQLMEEWAKGADKWQRTHDSIPTAFVGLAVLVDSLANASDQGSAPSTNSAEERKLPNE